MPGGRVERVWCVGKGADDTVGNWVYAGDVLGIEIIGLNLE